jgi:phage tail sheath protein FI
MPTYLTPGVYVEEVPSGSRPIEGVGTAVAGFVGFAEQGPYSQPVLVTNWTQYVNTFGAQANGYYLPHAVYGYFLNGGGPAYVVRLPDGSDSEHGGNGAVASHARAGLPAAGDEQQTAFALQAVTAGPEGDGITVAVAEASQPHEDTFKLEVRQGGELVETFDNLTTRRGANNVATVLAKKSRVITLVETKNVTVAVPKMGVTVDLAGGSLPAVRQIEAQHIIGETSERTGFSCLEAIDEVTMLAVPDLMSAYERGLIGMDGVKAVQLAMIAHAELLGDRVAIVDPPPGLSALQAKQWRTEIGDFDSKYAALYWPWLDVMDPIDGRLFRIPPSGHMAGIWARSDDTRGVHKAPANEVVRGALALEYAITKGEQSQLNPIGVNCIRAFPGQGIRVWGARTLSSDPEWRYLNVRRLFNFIEESILAGTNWVVFEPNDQYLWESVRRNVGAFLRQVWRAGALMGATPNEAFFVKCDEENNPPESRDAGNLVVEVGIAPVKPAEFVVFRISQWSQGAGLEE